MTQLYNGPQPDAAEKTDKDFNTKKRKADNAGQHKRSSRNVEITVVGIRKSATSKYAMISSLLQMLEDRNIGKVKIPEGYKQLLQQKSELQDLKTNLPSFFNPTNIVSLKTTAPILNKKQLRKREKEQQKLKEKDQNIQKNGKEKKSSTGVNDQKKINEKSIAKSLANEKQHNPTQGPLHKKQRIVK